MATTTLNIQGMTCNGCVNSVTRVLTGIAGVSRADVDLAGAKAVVEYDAAQLTAATSGCSQSPGCPFRLFLICGIYETYIPTAVSAATTERIFICFSVMLFFLMVGKG